MTNERITEDIVRRHFQSFGDDVVVEEQKSQNDEINQILSKASKSGTGRLGRPEFVIRFQDEPNLVAVVECKANRLKHKSPDLNIPKDYALDGALHYAGYLSRTFDVLAIAVSGTKKLDISHHLLLKGQVESKQFAGDALLTPEDYLKAYYHEPEKFNQDYQSLQEYIIRLNSRLHQDKVGESERAILISAILIALDRKAFRNGYPYENDPKQLAKSVVDNAIAQLKGASVSAKGIDILKRQFGFLLTSPILSRKKHELKEVIREIDSEVNSFIKNYEYLDILGKMYIEFLRYANSEKGLGIVLTPPHITDFFADVAQLNKKSIIYDNCVGTGGFLISAMKKMVLDARGNSAVINNIKKHQIFGVEIQPSIFTLAVSNMYIHQDGKSNVMQDSCFERAVMSKIKALKPTVGFLNPPYKSDKKKDIEELEFVKNNLDCLHQGGISIAIVPMQSALNSNKKITQIKKDILEKHSLEAVFSMPDELFFDSDVTVVTCVMVFTAHRPHPKKKQVFLGYFKDDGFVKRRIGGRTDALGRWNGIRENWLNLFLNRKEKRGLSVCTQLDASDDWSPEAYMKTDYSTLSDKDFENTMQGYSTYLFSNGKTEAVSNRSLSKGRLDLDDRKWSSFNLKDLFDIEGSKTTLRRDLDMDDEAQGNDYPYVTTQSVNNGVADFYGNYSEMGNILTVDSAVAGYCAYQHWNFHASDHVEKLVPKFKMNSLLAMFFVTIINRDQYKYNYGRKCSQTRLKQTRINLPTDRKTGNPDFRFMESYIRQRKFSANCIHY